MDEDTSPVDSQASSPFGAAQTPRLGISHLLLWTFCSAVHLSLVRAMYATPGDMPDGATAIYNVSSAIYGVAIGAYIAGSLVLVSVHVRTGPPLLRQPGHWLLFIPAVLYLISLPLFVWLSLLENAGQSLMLLYALSLATYPVAHALAAWRQPTRRWRAFFVALAVVGLMQSSMYVAWWVSYNRPTSIVLSHWTTHLTTAHSWGNLLLIGAVLAISVFELVTGRRRDWLHWTGVSTYLTVTSIPLLQVVASRFIR